MARRSSDLPFPAHQVAPAGLEAQAVSAAAKAPRYYRPELDVLRCLAFLMVFTSHIPFNAWAIPVFYTLSVIEEAFLHTELLLREREDTGTIHRLAFFIRRMLRIWPLYFAVILLSVAGSFVYHRWTAPARFVVPYLLLTGNVATAHLGAYPRNPLLGPLWSISVEEQFYLLWPLLLLWQGRNPAGCVAG